MPVYVTRAHVTIGDAKAKEKKRGPIVPRHVFQVSDIRRTPYCIRTFLFTLMGFIIVGGGVIMTIIGYKPSILLPWYQSSNKSSRTNVTDPSAVPSVLGEPGPLRVLVYFGPILMGVGVFSMMVAIVLFCEIKDRYFNNILPKIVPEHQKREKMYDKIIAEFRKNYFRGIEVPLKPPRKRSKSRFSFSLSRSGSLASFGRRLSHDFQKRFRRSSKDSQTEKITSKSKRPAIRKQLYTDSWMKTSSLPNIRHKDSMHSIYEAGNSMYETPKRTAKSCGPTFEKLQLAKPPNGIDNPAYKNSPPNRNRKTKPNLTKHASLDTSNRNKHVTTVIVHRESNHDMDENPVSPVKTSYLPELTNSRDRALNSSVCGDSFDGSVVDIDRDIDLSPSYNEINETLQPIPAPERPGCLPSSNININQNCDMCTCGTDIFCSEHASLGMDSGGSSLSLSWDNIPSEWNDSRRNTEPVVFYRRSFNNPTGSCLSDNLDLSQNSTTRCTMQKTDTASVTENTHNTKQKSTGGSFDNFKSKVAQSIKNGPFKTQISVFKSDSNLMRVGKYTLLRPTQLDSISLDSLNLTDEMMQNFDKTETDYI